MRKPNKARALKYMAKHQPDRLVVETGADFVMSDFNPDSVSKAFAHWQRCMDIKHGSSVTLRMEHMYDPNNNLFIYIGRVARKEPSKSVRAKTPSKISFEESREWEDTLGGRRVRQDLGWGGVLPGAGSS